MMEQIVKYTLVCGQFLPLQMQVAIKLSQSHQGLMPDDIIQSTTHCPRRMGPLFTYIIGQHNNLKLISIFYQEEKEID